MQLLHRHQIMEQYAQKPHLFDPAKFGFEFSKEYIEGRLDARLYRGSDFLVHFDRAWRDKSQPTAA